MGPNALARVLNSTPQQIWRLDNGKATSFRYLARLVSVFGLVKVSSIIADESISDAFTFWYTATHESPKAKAKRKAA